MVPPGTRLPLGVFIPHPDPPRLFSELARIGVGAVEPNIGDPMGFDARGYLNAARDQGLSIAAVSTGLSTLFHQTDLSHPDAGHREKSLGIMERFIEIANALEAPVVVVGVARGRCRGDCPSAVERLRSSLEALDKHSSQAGIRVVLEPLNSYETDLVNTVGQALGVIEGLENVYILLDTFHAMLEHESPQKAIEAAGSRIGHVHFADSNRRAPGRGVLDWRSILEALEKVGYRGYASVEAKIMPNYLEELSHALETIKRAGESQ